MNCQNAGIILSKSTKVLWDAGRSSIGNNNTCNACSGLYLLRSFVPLHACKYNSLNVNNMQETLTQLDDLHCHSKFEILIHCRAHNGSNPDISVCLLGGRSGHFGSTKTSHKERNGEDLVV